MHVTWQGQNLIIDDGPGAHYGIGVLVPAIIVFALFMVVMSPVEVHSRLELAALMSFLVAVALAVLRAPRRAEFDVERSEVHLEIGWPPFLGRRKVTPFSDIRDARVWQPIRLSDDFGAARPALVLRPGKTVFLSTYNRSPKFCRTIVTQVQQVLSAGVANSRDGKR
jgi:hypothetical protein